MTDTKDIAALRESAESMMNLLENLAGYEPQDIDMDAVELRFEDENGFDTGCDISIVDTARQSADIIRALLDQLEAERQRAAELSERQSKNGVGKLQSEVIRLRIENAALKGDQAPVSAGTSEKCSPDVYTKGVSACLIDIPKEKAEVICRGISAASGVAVDWHYFGGRVHIKAMRVNAPQKPIVLPKSHYVCGCADRFMSAPEVIAAIKAAGGIVKDGE